MTCRDIEERLPQYLEGAITPKERVFLKAHLATCARCAGLLAALQATETSLAGFPKVEVPRRLLSRLRAIPGRAERPGAWDILLRPSLQPLFASMGILLILVSVFLLNPGGGRILRAIDRQVHMNYSRVERLWAKAGSVADSLGSYKEELLVSFNRINFLAKERE